MDGGGESVTASLNCPTRKRTSFACVPAGGVLPLDVEDHGFRKLLRERREPGVRFGRDDRAFAEDEEVVERLDQIAVTIAQVDFP